LHKNDVPKPFGIVPYFIQNNFHPYIKREAHRLSFFHHTEVKLGEFNKNSKKLNPIVLIQVKSII